MSARKDYEKVTAAELEYQKKVSSLTGTVDKLERGQPALEAEAFRAEVLGEGGWKGKRDEADHNKGLLDAAKAELGKAKVALAILADEKTKLREALKSEILAEHRPKFLAGLKDLYSKFNEAVAIRQTLDDLNEAAYQEIIGIGCQSVNTPLSPAGLPNFGEDDRDGGVRRNFRVQCGRNDYDIEE